MDSPLASAKSETGEGTNSCECACEQPCLMLMKVKRVEEGLREGMPIRFDASQGCFAFSWGVKHRSLRCVCVCARAYVGFKEAAPLWEVFDGRVHIVHKASESSVRKRQTLQMPAGPSQTTKATRGRGASL